MRSRRNPRGRTTNIDATVERLDPDAQIHHADNPAIVGRDALDADQTTVTGATATQHGTCHQDVTGFEARDTDTLVVRADSNLPQLLAVDHVTVSLDHVGYSASCAVAEQLGRSDLELRTVDLAVDRQRADRIPHQFDRRRQCR